MPSYKSLLKATIIVFSVAVFILCGIYQRFLIGLISLIMLAVPIIAIATIIDDVKNERFK